MRNERRIGDPQLQRHRHPDIYIIQHLVHFSSFCLIYSALALNSSWPRWIQSPQEESWINGCHGRFSHEICGQAHALPRGSCDPMFRLDHGHQFFGFIHQARSPVCANQPCKNHEDHWWSIKVDIIDIIDIIHHIIDGLPSKHLNTKTI